MIKDGLLERKTWPFATRWISICYTSVFFLRHCMRRRASEFHIGAQALDGLGREVLAQFQVVERIYSSVQPAVFYYGLGLIEAYVWMSAQTAERQSVEVEPANHRMLHHEIGYGRLGKVVNLAQLINADISAQPTAVAHYGVGKAAAYARHALQLRRVSRVQHDMFAGLYLHGISRRVAYGQVGSAASIHLRCRTIVALDAYVWLQFLKLLRRKSVKACKVGLGAIYSALGPVLIYVSDLPRRQPEPQQLCAVCRVRVEV